MDVCEQTRNVTLSTTNQIEANLPIIARITRLTFFEFK